MSSRRRDWNEGGGPCSMNSSTTAHSSFRNAPPSPSTDRYGSIVCALVVPSGEVPSVDDLRMHCQGRLAGYKAPRRMITVDTIGRGPAGKPDYAWARAVVARA